MLLFHFISSYYTDVLCVLKVSLLAGIDKELTFKELELNWNWLFLKPKELELTQELIKRNWNGIWNWWKGLDPNSDHAGFGPAVDQGDFIIFWICLKTWYCSQAVCRTVYKLITLQTSANDRTLYFVNRKRPQMTLRFSRSKVGKSDYHFGLLWQRSKCARRSIYQLFQSF